VPTDIVMPQMGESIFEGTITKWLKKPGDKVQRDEPLFEISTDKVDAEIPAPASGILQDIKVVEGNTVQVNTVVGTIAGDGEAASTRPVAEVKAAESAPPAPPKKEAAAPAVIPQAESKAAADTREETDALVDGDTDQARDGQVEKGVADHRDVARDDEQLVVLVVRQDPQQRPHWAAPSGREMALARWVMAGTAASRRARSVLLSESRARWMAASRALRSQNPAHIVVAVPVAASETCERKRQEADDIVCVSTPEPIGAVGEWYDNFSQTSDKEVQALLDRARDEVDIAPEP